MFKAVVFDMDGVIFDTEKLYRRFQLEEAEKRGIPREEMLKVCVHLAGGNKYTSKPVFESMIGRGIDYFEFRESMINSLDAYIKENGVELKSGVLETLTYLKEHGYQVGLATSTVRERAITHLKNHNLEKYFDRLIFGDMIANGKPAPDIYLKACEELGVNPDETVAVEDSINGIISAGTGGLYPVMVVDLIEPNEKIEPYVKKVYRNMSEMLEILE